MNYSSATNRLITSKDHASVQINVGHLDERGVYTGGFTTFALCGFVRAQVVFLALLFVFFGNWHLRILWFVYDCIRKGLLGVFYNCGNDCVCWLRYIFMLLGIYWFELIFDCVTVVCVGDWVSTWNLRVKKDFSEFSVSYGLDEWCV